MQPLRVWRLSATASLPARGSEQLDVAFVLDLTGSMGSWIDQCKTHVASIIASLRSDLDVAEVVVWRGHGLVGAIPGLLIAQERGRLLVPGPVRLPRGCARCGVLRLLSRVTASSCQICCGCWLHGARLRIMSTPPARLPIRFRSPATP